VTQREALTRRSAARRDAAGHRHRDLAGRPCPRGGRRDVARRRHLAAGHRHVKSSCRASRRCSPAMDGIGARSPAWRGRRRDGPEASPGSGSGWRPPKRWRWPSASRWSPSEAGRAARRGGGGGPGDRRPAPRAAAARRPVRPLPRDAAGTQLVIGAELPDLPADAVIVAVDLAGRAPGAAVARGDAATDRLPGVMLRLGAVRLARGGLGRPRAGGPEYVTLRGACRRRRAPRKE